MVRRRVYRWVFERGSIGAQARRVTVIDVTMDQMLFLLRRGGEMMLKKPGNELPPELRRVMDHPWLVYGDPWLVYGYTSSDLTRRRSHGLNIHILDLAHYWLLYITDRDVRLTIEHLMLWDSVKGSSIWSTKRLATKMGRTRQTIWEWEKKGYETMHRGVVASDDIRLPRVIAQEEALVKEGAVYV